MTDTDYESALAATRAFHHKQKGFNGRFLLRYLDDIRDIVRAHQCPSGLDYGCGRGEQYQGTVTLEELSRPPREVSIAEYLGLADIKKYDPGVPEFSVDPQGRYDVVFATQSLSSIPVASLQSWVLDRVASYAIRAVYIGEVLNDQPRKTLHRSLASAGKMPHGWSREQWLELLTPVAARHPSIAFYLRTKDKRTGAPKGTRHLDTFNVQADR